MLTICSDPLPRTDLTYAAFRASFHETLERLVLARQFDNDPWQSFGFLTQVPFLKSVPPQVQLDLLSETWHRHVCSETQVASLVDEAVIFAACETAARMARVNLEEFSDVLERGPQRLVRDVQGGLAEAMKQLHMALRARNDRIPERYREAFSAGIHACQGVRGVTTRGGHLVYGIQLHGLSGV